MASQSNGFRALYDERKIEGKFIIRVFQSIRSLYKNPELYYNTMYHHIFILKSLLFDSIHVSKELLPISDERIIRNCC